MIDDRIASNLLAWSLQGGLLAGAARVTLRALRIEAPVIRYTAWRTVLVLCLALPLLQTWQLPVAEPIEVPILSSDVRPASGRTRDGAVGADTFSSAISTPVWPPEMIVSMSRASPA